MIHKRPKPPKLQLVRASKSGNEKSRTQRIEASGIREKAAAHGCIRLAINCVERVTASGLARSA